MAVKGRSKTNSGQRHVGPHLLGGREEQPKGGQMAVKWWSKGGHEVRRAPRRPTGGQRREKTVKERSKGRSKDLQQAVDGVDTAKLGGHEER